MGTIADRIALVRDALARGIVSLGQMARAESGDGTKALFGDGSFKAPGGGISSLSEPTSGDIRDSGTLAIGSGAAPTNPWDPFGNGLTGSFGLVTRRSITSLPGNEQDGGIFTESVVNLDADANFLAEVWQLISAILIADTNASYVGSAYAIQAQVVNNGSGHLELSAGVSAGVFNEAGSSARYAAGLIGTAENDGNGTVTQTIGVWAYPAQNYGAGTVTAAAGLYVDAPSNSGTVGTNYGAWIAYQNPASGGGTTSNSYAFWYDSPGVFRIKYDGVMAYYNPAFSPKYTPGGTDFERIVQQWNTNVAEIGLEAGGTGTLRGLRLIGDHVEFPAFLEITEIADPAAPAATKARLYTKNVGGKVALMARFPTGAVQQIAIEP